MRSFLMNKNLSLYYLLRRRIGRKQALPVAISIKKVLLIFGREKLSGLNENCVPAEKQEIGGILR